MKYVFINFKNFKLNKKKYVYILLENNINLNSK